jgi:hypothetical protein
MLRKPRIAGNAHEHLRDTRPKSQFVLDHSLKLAVR